MQRVIGLFKQMWHGVGQERLIAPEKLRSYVVDTCGAHFDDFQIGLRSNPDEIMVLRDRLETVIRQNIFLVQNSPDRLVDDMRAQKPFEDQYPEFEDLAEGLFGPHWRSKVVRLLGITQSQVGRWEKLREAVPDDVMHRMRKALEDQAHAGAPVPANVQPAMVVAALEPNGDENGRETASCEADRPVDGHSTASDSLDERVTAQMPPTGSPCVPPRLQKVCSMILKDGTAGGITTDKLEGDVSDLTDLVRFGWIFQVGGRWVSFEQAGKHPREWDRAGRSYRKLVTSSRRFKTLEVLEALSRNENWVSLTAISDALAPLGITQTKQDLTSRLTFLRRYNRGMGLLDASSDYHHIVYRSKPGWRDQE